VHQYIDTALRAIHFPIADYQGLSHDLPQKRLRMLNVLI
jgi:hypothetical protein